MINNQYNKNSFYPFRLALPGAKCFNVVEENILSKYSYLANQLFCFPRNLVTIVRNGWKGGFNMSYK